MKFELDEDFMIFCITILEITHVILGEIMAQMMAQNL